MIKHLQFFKKGFLLLFFSFLLWNSNTNAATLAAGDLAVVGWSALTDKVNIVTLASIPSGTVIKITDRGWDQSTDAFTTGTTGDGTVTWTTTSTVTAGTVLELYFGGSDATTTLTNITTNTSLTSEISVTTYTVADPMLISGDQIFIYQDTDTNPFFIFGMNNSAGTVDGNNWNTSIAILLRDSMLPDGTNSQNSLTNGTNAIGIAGGASQQDNIQYTGPTTSANKATWLSRLVNSTNWTGDNTGSTTNVIGTSSGSVVNIASLAAPTVTTASASSVLSTSVMLGGNVTADGGATVSERGIVYATTTNPTTSNTRVQIGSGTGTFSQSVTGLSSGTTYYVRAYAINSQATSYGSQVTFTTLSTNANLSSLALNSGTLSPTFASGTTSYTASVSNATNSITVTPTVSDATATVTVNGITVTSGSASGSIALSVGSNTITTVVTAQDGSTTKTYTVTVTRAASTNANLSSLALSSGTLTPTFASGTTSYTTSVSNATSSITVTPTVSDATATVTVNGTTVTSGSASGSIALSVGSNTITTVVTAQDGSTTKTYTVTVTRAASTNANLASLSLSSGTLSPTFASGTTSYTASVSNATSSITVTPTVSDATATVTVNGTTVTSGSASGSTALSVGSNTITTVVTAQDGSTTKTYTVTVTRAASTNANLASLSLSSGTLSPTFASGTTSYTASVSNATSSITVTPTVSDATATVTVNGTAVTSGSTSGSIALSVGSNTITTVVTAQDGITTQTYTVTVTRDAPATTSVSSIVRASTNPSNASSVNYTVTFAASVTGVDATDFTLTTTGVSGASVGTPTGSGTSWTVPVNTGTGSGTIRLDFTGTTGVTPNVSASYTSGEVYTIDRTGPTVSSVASTSLNGVYTIGNTIGISVTFSEAATVAGTPQLTLETGTTDRVADYVSGSGTTTLLFNYTVQAGDTNSDLDYISTSALSLNGGTIKDAVGNNAVLTLPTPGAANSLSANSNININTTPVVSTSGTLSAFTTCSGTASSSQSFTVSGGNLGANLVVTAPTGFEVSTTSGSGYGSTVSLAPSSNSVANTTIYVRLTSSASGSPSGNIAVTSTGATTKNVAASGTVNALPVVAAISGGSSVAVGQTLQLSNSTGGGTWSSSNTSAATIDASGLVTGVAMGSTTITYTVTTSGCSTSVTKNVEVLGVGSLASITLSAGTLTPAFSSSTTNYTASVSNSTSSITVSASALHGTASVNGTPNSASIPLNVGTNTINVTVSYNSGYTGTSSYTIVVTRDAAATTTVSSIVRASGNPTNATSVNYTVTFAASVTGVDAGDFTLASTSTANGTIGTPTGSGTTWTVPINSVSGNGTLRLDFTGTAGVTPNVSASYTSGEIYTIDNTAPSVTSVAVPANGTYKTGDNLNFTVNFDENVTVTGAPYLAVTLNTGGTVNATYQSGSGTSALIFRYTVASGNADADGIALASSITANGGTLKDAVGNNATFTLNSVGSTALVKVDGIAPTLSTVTIASNNATTNLAKSGDVVSLNITASENINTPTITIAGQPASVTGSGSSYSATYTMAGSDTEGAVPFSVSFSDLAGNNGTAVIATSNSSSVTFDKTAPAVPAGLAATSGDTENLLNWTANSEGDLKSYKVFGGTSANPTTLLSSITAGTITYTHTGLTNGTTYYYRITSIDNAGNESAYSSDVTAVPRASQTITFNPLSAVTYGAGDFDAGATASSGLAVSYTSDNTSVASIVAGKIHIVGQGTANITASQAGNSAYLAASSVSRSLTINKKQLTLTLNSIPAITKVYDGNTTASLGATNYNLTDKVGADVVTVSGTASYDNKSAGTGKTVTVNSFVLAGAQKDNYTLGVTSLTTTGAITAKALTASIQTISKEYDGNANASVTFDAVNAAAGLVGSDNVSVVYTSASYDTKSIGTGKTVTITGASLSGTDKDNYSLNAFTSTTGAITAKALIATVQPVSKEYDGNATATVTFNPLTGFVSGETVGVTYTSASYDTKNVGTGKTVTVTGAALSGADKDNYTLNAFTSTPGAITAKALTASAQPVTKVYDGTTNATITFNVLNAAAGLVGSDNVSVVYTSAFYDTKNVGTGKAVTVTGAALSGTDKDNYTLNAFTSATGAITTKALTASVQTVSKEYDGTANATVTFNALNAAAGLVGSDNVSVVYTSASYDNKNIGSVKAVTITGAALSGTDKDNYSLNAFTSTTGSITAKALTATVQPVTKEYDGNSNATITFNPLTGFVSGETVGVTYTSASYNNKNVGTGKTITIVGLALDGANKDNYSLNPFSVTGSITAKELTASLTGAVTKVYDGNTTASLTAGNYSLPGKVGSEDVTLNNPATGSYDTKNIGTGKTVTVTGLSISGTDVANYSLASTTINGAIGTITAKELTASLTGTVTKVYDGNTTASLTAGNYSLPGKVGSEDVTLNNPTAGTYDTKNIGSGKIVTVTGLSISGAAAGNYSLASTTINGTVGAITAKELTASLIGTVTKIYDGNTTAILTGSNYSLQGKVGTEDVTLNNPTSGTYDNKNIGTGKTVTVTGLSISGTDAANYSLASTTINGTVGAITAKELTASLAGAVTKVYDGNTTASLTAGNYSLTSRVGSEIVTLNNPTNGTYDNKNVGTGKTVTVTGLSILGADAANYSLASTTINGAIGTITAKELTASLTGTVTKVYDGNTTASLTAGNYSLTSRVGSEIVTLDNPANGTYDNKNVGAGKTVTVTGLSISGADAGNYSLASTTINGAIGVITTKALTASAQPVIKVYDGNANATINFDAFNAASGKVGSDDVSVTYVSASYNNKDVGSGKAVTINGLVLAGAEKNNYSLNPFTTTGDITAKSITLALNAIPAITKVYDGTTTATLVAGNYSLTGVETGDAVTVSGTANYDNKNVATGKTVTVNAFVLGGAQKDNYSLTTASASTTGSITAKPITLALNAAPVITKVYDGTPSAILATANYSLSGVVSGDVLSASGTAVYDNKNVGAGKAVTANTFVLAGADKDNYNLTTASAGTTGNVTAKALIITAEDKEKFQGLPLPVFTATYSGFIPGESSAVLATQPSFSTTATANSPQGTYPIIVSGATAANYSISFVNGVLTVKPGYPTGLNLAVATVFENAPVGTLAGTLSSTSDDPTTTFAYSLVAGSGDTDNSKFSILNNELRTSASLNFEEKSSYNVRIRTTALNSTLTLDKEFTITINNVNEQPTLNDIAAQTICYTTSQQTIALGDISAGPDANQTTTVSVSSTNNALFKSLTVTQATGGNAQLKYTVADGASGNGVVNVMVTDNGGTANGGVNTILKSFMLTVNPLPVAAITANKSTTISKGDVLVLTATGGTSYQWNNANGIQSGQNNHNLTVRPSETTTYRVLVSNANNCQSWAEITVEVLNDYQLVKGTNILTPNGDNINDNLVIRNLDLYPNNVVKIFDRAGRLLYSKANYNDEWNGTFNGSPLAEDTYYYIVDFGGNKPKIKGFVTIVRD